MYACVCAFVYEVLDVSLSSTMNQDAWIDAVGSSSFMLTGWDGMAEEAGRATRAPDVGPSFVSSRFVSFRFVSSRLRTPDLGQQAGRLAGSYSRPARYGMLLAELVTTRVAPEMLIVPEARPRGNDGPDFLAIGSSFCSLCRSRPLGGSPTARGFG